MTTSAHRLDQFIDGVVFAVVVIISIILIRSNNNPQLAAFQQDYLEVTGTIQGQVEAVDDYFDLKSENDSLKLEIERISHERQRYIDAYFELNRLKQLVSIRPLGLTRDDFIYAEVADVNINGYQQTMTLNKGRQDSVRFNAPVIHKGGLVGRVIQVSSTYSLVQLATDHRFEVSARILRLGEFGTVRWDGFSRFNLLFISKNVPVVAGDVIVTSGLSDIYPKHIRIGVVESVNSEQSGLFHTIKVIPAVNVRELEFCAILHRSGLNRIDSILVNYDPTITD